MQSIRRGTHCFIFVLIFILKFISFKLPLHFLFLTLRCSCHFCYYYFIFSFIFYVVFLVKQRCGFYFHSLIDKCYLWICFPSTLSNYLVRIYVSDMMLNLKIIALLFVFLIKNHWPHEYDLVHLQKKSGRVLLTLLLAKELLFGIWIATASYLPQINPFAARLEWLLYFLARLFWWELLGRA